DPLYVLRRAGSSGEVPTIRNRHIGTSHCECAARHEGNVMSPRIRTPLIAAMWRTNAVDASESAPQSSQASPARGERLENPPPQLGLYAPAELISKITDGTISRRLLRHVFSPQCSVAVYQLRYGTIGARHEPTNGSAALMIPSGHNQLAKAHGRSCCTHTGRETSASSTSRTSRRTRTTKA